MESESARLHWPSGFVCPECGNTTFGVLRRRWLYQCQVLPGLPGSLDEAIDLFPVGAGEGEAAAGGHKLAYLLQRETLSMLPGDSHSPAVCPDPTAVFSGSSRVGNTPPFQDHLALDNSELRVRRVVLP